MDDYLWDLLTEIEEEREEFERNLLEQPLISEKKEYNGYSVERKYVNSKAYHDKFEQLPVSKKVSESLYKQAGRLLEFVDGQEEERLLAVNGRTGDFLVDNFNRPGSADRTGFSYEEFQYVKNCPDSVILMHNHSRNGPPSAQDIIAYALDDKIKMSIILCHDGDVYTILKASKEVKKIYEDILERYKSYISDLSLAKKLASDALYKANKDVNEKFFEIGGL